MKRKWWAELMGTFGLVLAGCGAVVVDDLYGGLLGLGGISAVFGLIVMVMIYALGDVSGAHINPAVTLAFWVARRVPGKQVLPYLSAQIAGGCIAALLLHLLFPAHETLGATRPAGAVWQAFAFEFILTLVLMFVILQVSTCGKEEGIMAGITVGGAVSLLVLIGGPVTGGSMNPARSVGPALLSLQVESLWIYLTAPVLGAITAVPLYWLSRAVNSAPQEG